MTTFTEPTKTSTTFTKLEWDTKTYRATFGDDNTRGEIALSIHGSLTAEVTRNDMQERYRVRKASPTFTEPTKTTTTFTEPSK